MKENRLLYLIGDIDDRFVEAAEFPKKKSIVRPILKYGSIAACFCLLAAAALESTTASIHTMFRFHRQHRKAKQPKTALHPMSRNSRFCCLPLHLL